MISFSKFFFFVKRKTKPTTITTMYSEYFQQLKRKRSQETPCMAAFLIKIVYSKTFMFFDFTKF